VEQLVREVPKLVVLVAGDGPLADDLKRQAANSRLASVVKFLGRREDIPALLAASNVYVCSSDAEGMSNSILEAMAAGLPVIATNVGDNTKLIRDDFNGFVVPPGSTKFLTTAIRHLADDMSLCKRMSVSARQLARSFALSDSTDTYQELYAKCLSAGVVFR
jgi:glycosyltransferase involved in cell wall biosynthesis